MDQIIQESLAGRRFALMGFDLPERDSIIATLRTVGGIGHVIEAVPSAPELSSSATFDACFINASAAATSEQPVPIELIAPGHQPAIVIGSFDDLVTRFAEIADLDRREFILRPYETEDLLLRACRVLRFVERSEVANRSPGCHARRRVVVADDDATSNVMISTILKHFNYECVIVRDGEEAVYIARQFRPDLMLLDVSMPRMDGFQALTALRSNRATRRTPVILVSAHRDEAEVVKGFSLGADDYVTKPFNSGELMARINHVLRAPEEI